MPLDIQQDVYIVSRDDTGEVKDLRKDSIYLVLRDGDKTEGDHHEEDLKKIPFHSRIHYRSFYNVVTAIRTAEGRNKETRSYRNGGGRIR